MGSANLKKHHSQDKACVRTSKPLLMFPPNGLVEKVRFAHTTQHGAIAGKISAEIAKQKADTEYAKFRERTKYELSPVEIHFIDQFEAEQKRLKEKGNS